MFDVNYDTISLDNILGNPSPTYTAVSGMDLAKRSSHIMGNIAKGMVKDPELLKSLKGYINVKQQKGASLDQVLDAIANDPTAPTELKEALQSLYNSPELEKLSDADKEKSKKLY